VGWRDTAIDDFRIPTSAASEDQHELPLQGLFFLNSDLVMVQRNFLPGVTTPGREDDTAGIKKRIACYSAKRQRC
jgi:hypothetical protein